MCFIRATAVLRLVFVTAFFATGAANAACWSHCYFDYSSVPWGAAADFLSATAPPTFALLKLEITFPVSHIIALPWHGFGRQRELAPDLGRIDWTNERGRMEEQQRRQDQWVVNEFTKDPRMREISKVWVGWLDQPDRSNSAFVELLQSEGFSKREIGRWAATMRRRDAWLGIGYDYIHDTFDGLPSGACEPGAYKDVRAGTLEEATLAEGRRLFGCTGTASDPGVVK
jgi:hypothetical protein